MPETFTDDQVISALESWVSYGEQTLGTCQKGYFSGGGWAARCLRWHLQQLRADVGKTHMVDAWSPSTKGVD